MEFRLVERDRGAFPVQPMIVLCNSGDLEEQQQVAEQWCDRLRAAAIPPARTRIEAGPGSFVEHGISYFEHLIEVRLPAPDPAVICAITNLAETYGARFAQEDGRRLVTQRCHDVSRAVASGRRDALVAALTDAGHLVVAAEQRQVVDDSHLDLDHGWLSVGPPRRAPRDSRDAEAGGVEFPPTYQPLSRGRAVRQRGAFDPALIQFPCAFTAGEPVFADPALGLRWRQARTAAMTHVLAVIAGSPWVEQLVLRGSVTMASWVGEAARRPGDLDFVVVPQQEPADGPLVGEIAALLTANPGAGMRPRDIARSEIWTYERAEGRRLVIPFGGDGIPDGTVQIDLVFGEDLPIGPEPLEVLGEVLWAATAELSLAWKLQWLATDRYPQGKDLYDAVLLAEYTTVDPELVRDLIRAARVTVEEPMIGLYVDWENLIDEYPGIPGTADQWHGRLARALSRSSSDRFAP
ncbi:nucleotidyl transferase AbiEii/AbiGii toxin family protein [Actinoplanes rectilineatus]|uniref:nucleotidyl transferase AbiEii/AbiGii toxin family protein n=1 Tax=Actinoplanes rectilineatus TaxID=113571 RepID=UPI000A4FCCC8|nr:nucleotidyl transferase AbiEii/AbiGii toxin family protein [Actinoplanes rectilineatus]